MLMTVQDHYHPVPLEKGREDPHMLLRIMFIPHIKGGMMVHHKLPGSIRLF
jgi:hypothetical protein